MRIARYLIVLVAFSLLPPARPARADNPDLRFLLAKLMESLDAGLSRGELHALRVDIGATIRLQVLSGANPLANLAGYAKTLAAVDQAWTVLASVPPCQIDKGAIRAPADCRALLDPLYKTLDLQVPDLTAAPNPGQWVQDLLKDLEHQTDTALRAVQ